MLKSTRETIAMLERDGFSVERTDDTCKHIKLYLHRDGVRFFVVTGKSPSDAYKGARNTVNDARKTFHRLKEAAMK